MSWHQDLLWAGVVGENLEGRTSLCAINRSWYISENTLGFETALQLYPIMRAIVYLLQTVGFYWLNVPGISPGLLPRSGWAPWVWRWARFDPICGVTIMALLYVKWEPNKLYSALRYSSIPRNMGIHDIACWGGPSHSLGSVKFIWKSYPPPSKCPFLLQLLSFQEMASSLSPFFTALPAGFNTNVSGSIWGWYNTKELAVLPGNFNRTRKSQILHPYCSCANLR